MLGRLNHVAIAVPDLAAAAEVYAGTLGAEVSAPQPLPEHGVTVVFVTLPNTKIELLEPLGEDSPIARFLEKNPAGGMHHLCYEVWYSRIARHRAKHATVAPPLKDDSIVVTPGAPTWKGPPRWPHDALSTPELPAGEDAFDEDDAIPIVRRELLVSEPDAAPERGPGRGSGSAG